MSSVPTQMVGGLVSGLDTNSIIDSYMQIERKPITLMEQRVLEYETKLEAYRSINNLLLDFSQKTEKLAGDDLWDVRSVVSSNESVLTATASDLASTGSYTFRVGQLAQTAQYMSGGFADYDSSPVSSNKPGFISIDSKRASLNKATSVKNLNGGRGIYHGSIKIRDTSGNTAVVDLSTASTLEEVIDRINGTDGVEVFAQVSGDSLKINDLSGGTGSLTISDYGLGTTASDLGIAGTSNTDNDGDGRVELTGDSICYLAAQTTLSSLHDGLGINNGTAGTIRIKNLGGDYVTESTSLSTLHASGGINNSLPGTINIKATYRGDVDATTKLDELRDGLGIEAGRIKVTVDGERSYIDLTEIDDTTTLDDIKSIIESETEGKATVSITASGLTIASTDGSEIKVEDLGNKTAEQLGIVGSDASGTITGADLRVLDMDVDLSDAQNVQDVIDAIANHTDNANGAVSLSVDSGTQLKVTGKAGFDVTVSSTGAANTTAEDLGIASSGVGEFTGSALNTLNENSLLSALNGGAGVAGGEPGTLTISHSDYVDPYEIDLSGATSIKQVLNRINDTAGGAFQAQLTADGTAIEFTTVSGDITSITSTDTTAQDLGIDGINAGNLTGTSLAPFEQTGFDVDLSDVTTMQGVVDAINAASLGAVTASLDGKSIKIEGMGAGSFFIESIGEGNTTAEDLGLTDAEFSIADNAWIGKKIIGGPNSVQIASISGVNGTGLNGAHGDYTQALSNLRVSNDGGTTWFDIELDSFTGEDSFNQVLEKLNSRAAEHFGAGQLEFRINSTGNGIEVVNNSSSNFQIEDNGGTTAADLGIDGITLNAGDTHNGGDVDVNYISRATKLSTLNNGNGVYAGSIKIYNSLGTSHTISLASATTIGEVIDTINNVNIEGLTASLNSTGDGILLTDTNASDGEIQVEEVGGGSTAQALGILGTGEGSIDGSFEKRIEVDENDTLRDIMNKIADSGSPIRTSIINDGSEYSPFRLVVSSQDSGAIGDFILDTDLEAFDFNQSAKGQDSILLYGQGGQSVSPIMLTSATNTNSTAVLGLTLDLNKVSDEYVTLTISEDTDVVEETVTEMVSSYNTLQSLVSELDTYNSEDESKGLLFGDTATRSLMDSLTDLFMNTVEGVDNGMIMFKDLGISFNDDGGLDLDSLTLSSKLSSDYESVKQLLTMARDVARKDLMGAASCTDSAGNGTSVSNIINGNSSSSDFGSSNGFESDSPIGAAGTSVNVAFPTPKRLTQLVLHHINTPDMPASEYALSDFEVEYLNAASNQWETLRSVTGNKSSATYLGFETPKLVSQIRVKGTKSNEENGPLRLIEIEAKEAQGLASEMNRVVGNLTDSSSGYFAQQEELISSQIDDLNNSIEKAEERLESVEYNYIREFAAMESSLSTITSQGNFFQSQMDAMNGND